MKSHFKWLSGLAAVGLFAAAPVAFADGPAVEEPNETIIVPSDEGATSPDVLPAPDQLEEDMTIEEEVVPAPELDQGMETQDQGTQEEVVPAPMPPAQQSEDTTVVPPAQSTPNVVIVNPEPAAQPRKRDLNNVLVEAGGGVASFSEDLGDQLDGGAGWTGRAIIGARTPIGVEVGYLGAVNAFETDPTIENITDVDTDNSVITTSGEALARVNFLGRRSPLKPFIAGGAGYLRLDTNEETSGLDDQDTISFPLAAGVQVFPTDNISIGARGNYRILSGLLDNGFVDGNQWDGILSVGANF